MVRETGLPNMDSKDVEEIFKGVLTDESRNQGHHNQPSPQQQHPGNSLSVLVLDTVLSRL